MEDLIGKKINYWTVIGKCDREPNKHQLWICKCECGNIKNVDHYNLIKNKSISCGCYAKKVVRETKTTHNKTNTRLYKVWCGMRERCYTKTHYAYKNYGGRGITICKEWYDDFNVFYNWAIKNGYDENAPKGQYTIERIDVNKGYNPQNCTFVNSKKQANNRRSNIFVEYNGKIKTLSEWSEIFNLEYKTILSRYKKMLNNNDNFKTLDDVFFKENIKEKEKIVIEYNGESHTLTEWSEIIGLDRRTIWYRYNKNMPIENILSPNKLK